MELTERELSVLISCVASRMDILKNSGDFPEEEFYTRLKRKLTDRWAYQIERSE